MRPLPMAAIEIAQFLLGSPKTRNLCSEAPLLATMLRTYGDVGRLWDEKKLLATSSLTPR